MAVLDLYGTRFPRGIHLIEASAGTGKTYSIAQLVAYFVVVEGISVEQMGVVTFTRAATAELRQRIHQRLCQVRDVLEGQGSDDESLVAWVETLENREQASRRVEAELLKLDLLSIQTIHSFCHHALRQQALEAGELLGQTLLEDDSAFNQAIIDDFWRQQMARLPSRHWRRILRRTPTPDRLLKAVTAWQPSLAFVPETRLPDEPELKVEPEDWRAFAAWMERCCGQELFKKAVREWWQRLRSEADLPQRLTEVELRADLLTFLAQGLDKRKVKPAQLESLPEFARHRGVLETLHRLGRQQALLEIAWLQHAWRHWQREYEARLRRCGQMTHDWVVRRLAQVVREAPITGLQQRFRVFLIDEFQDTDRHQWQIFSALFGSGQHWLFLIGDPKQSIYRFRGADLETYFRVAGQAQCFWHLGTNYRSHPDLVAAINRLFCDGGEDSPFGDVRLRYHPVNPGCRAEDLELHLGDRPVPPLWWQAFETGGMPYRYRNRDDATARLAAQITADVVELLERGILRERGQSRRLTPGDIAVLVRDNRTANRVREALREGGIPAVLIDRRSVYQTDTARKLYRLLVTLWEGADWPRVKRVLADGWFGCDAAQVMQAENGDSVAEWLGAFAEAGERWREDSLLAAVEGLFRRFGVWEHIAVQRFGPRILADLRHLLEMLQAEASRRHLGPQALLGWYRRRLDSPAGEPAQLRLENDDEAVQLVTMHSAKGLEYPVVLCFDLWLPEKRERPDPVVVSGDEGVRVVFQEAGEVYAEALQRHRLAERQESLRIAYVALTRAKAHCRVYLLEKEAKHPPWSPLRHLLTRQGCDDPFTGARRLAETRPRLFAYLRRSWDAVSAVRWHGGRHYPSLKPPRPLMRDLAAEVRVLTSYSALVRGRGHRPPSVGWIERLLEEGVADLETRLPRGAAFGNLLHGLLEKVPFAELQRGRIDPGLWQRCRRQAGIGDDLAVEEVVSLLQRVVTTPLPEFSLAEVDPGHQLHELEFFLPVARLEAPLLNHLLRDQPWFRPLDFPPVRGFLRGFIDLVVEHGGRFYLLDYKSNELEDYGPKALAAAMRCHDYGLQALLYAVALHRHLKSRLPGYRFESHFGGIRYLFLRGMDGTPGRGVYDIRPRPEWIAVLEGMLGE